MPRLSVAPFVSRVTLLAMVAGCAALASPSHLVAQAAAPFGGTYSVRGTNPGGTGMYIGTLRVDATGDTYRFAWETGSSSVGVGVRRGNTVAVAYGDNTCGVMLYERGKNNSLVGVWSAIGVTTTGTEIAVPAGGDLSAGFTVMGTNPGGGTPPYRGQMRLRPTGSTFDIHWTVGDRQYDGIGVRLDGTFGVAYGSPNCGVALYEITADGTLAGAWALRGQTAAGTETNTRR